MALISSMAIERPRTIASPDLADWPDMAATRPSLSGVLRQRPATAKQQRGGGGEKQASAETAEDRFARAWRYLSEGAIRGLITQATCQHRIQLQIAAKSGIRGAIRLELGNCATI